MIAKKIFINGALVCLLVLIAFFVLPVMRWVEQAKLDSCTTFTLRTDEAVYFGNNEDHSNPNGMIGFFPPTGDSFGMVKLGYLTEIDGRVTPSFQGGMNDQGLAWDVLGYQSTPLTPHPDRPLAFWDDNFLGSILKSCATVSDVIQMAKRYDFGDSMGMLIHVADASGDALVISPGSDGEVAFTRMAADEKYLLSVNINPVIPPGKMEQSLHAERFDIASRMLAEIDLEQDMDIESVAAVLDEVNLGSTFDAFFYSYTAYSNVFDLKQRRLYFYYLGQYNEVAALELDEELAKGERVVPMEEYFSPGTLERAQAEYSKTHIKANLIKIPLFLVLLSVIVVPSVYGVRALRMKRGESARENGMVEKDTSRFQVRSSRLLPVDALRGLIIVFMALDHANLFVAQAHSSGEYWGGVFPVYQELLPFLTRFVTHICAPGFFFLMGVGMLLFADSRRKQGWSEWSILRHFFLRGGLLIALQLLVVNRAWELSANWGIEFYVGVLFALGGTMILASLFLRLKPTYLLVFILALLVGTELLVPDALKWGQVFSILEHILFFSGGNFPEYWVNYPVLAWFELVLFGIVFGNWMIQDKVGAYRKALYMGVVFLAAFVALRFLDGFGNLRPRAGDDWMNFLNPVKYPPSITFTLMTIGINLLLLKLFDWVSQKGSAFLGTLAVFGRAPLFFYILHLFLYAGFGLWLAPGGTSLPVMYLFWILGLLVLYPFSLWYGSFKNRQPAGSVLKFL